MSLEIGWLFGVALAYLALLFLIAWSAERGLLPRALVRHPLVYALSLGVYATSWTYYGSVGLADRSGYAFLAIYLGLTGAFLLGPWLLRPIQRLCTDYQLSSIADLLAFRYGGRAAGVHRHAVPASSASCPTCRCRSARSPSRCAMLGGDVPRRGCRRSASVSLITGFAILFGARHLVAAREATSGLVVADRVRVGGQARRRCWSRACSSS